MKRVLVTGASGFLGRTTLEPLSKRGFRVAGVSRNTPSETNRVDWHQVDLLDAGQRRNLLQRVQATHLLHFAWEVTPTDYMTSPRNRDWVQASRELLKEFVHQGGRRAVVAGSCLEYDWTATAPFNETTTPIGPTTLYGDCKDQFRLEMQALAESSSMSCAWGRVFHCFGPHEKPERLVPYVIQSLLAGEVAQCSHGYQVCDFMDSRDIGDAFVALLDTEKTGPFNIASGEALRVRDLVERVAEKTGRPDLVAYDPGPDPNENVPKVFADVSRLRDEVGWNPQCGFDERLEQVIEWWKQRRESVASS